MGQQLLLGREFLFCLISLRSQVLPRYRHPAALQLGLGGYFGLGGGLFQPLLLLGLALQHCQIHVRILNVRVLSRDFTQLCQVRLRLFQIGGQLLQLLFQVDLGGVFGDVPAQERFVDRNEAGEIPAAAQGVDVPVDILDRAGRCRADLGGGLQRIKIGVSQHQLQPFAGGVQLRLGI